MHVKQFRFDINNRTSAHMRQLSGLLCKLCCDWLSPCGVIVYRACLDTGLDPHVFTQPNVFLCGVVEIIKMSRFAKL